jgi:hypothetical protein
VCPQQTISHHFLQVVVDSIGNPGHYRKSRNELVELMAVHEEYIGSAALNDDFIRTGHSEQMGDDFRGAVVIAVNPNDFDLI